MTISYLAVFCHVLKEKRVVKSLVAEKQNEILGVDFTRMLVTMFCRIFADGECFVWYGIRLELGKYLVFSLFLQNMLFVILFCILFLYNFTGVRLLCH